jgi:hypothetical protein
MFRNLLRSAKIALCVISTTALAASDTYLTTDSTDCELHPDAVTCIPGPDPDDLPGDPIDPGPTDPGGPVEPTLVYRVCTARVLVNNATALGQLHTLIACPGGSSAGGFHQAKLQMLNGTPITSPSFPKCNQQGNVIRILYPWARGVTFTSPEIGECLDRFSNVLFSRPL